MDNLEVVFVAEYETRNVVLDPATIEIVDQVVEDKGLGGKGFSAGLRMIVREWRDYQDMLASHAVRVAQEASE